MVIALAIEQAAVAMAAIAIAVTRLLGEDGGDALGDFVNAGEFGVGEEFGAQGFGERRGIAFGLKMGGNGCVGRGLFGLCDGGVIRGAGDERNGRQEQQKMTHI